MESGARRLVDRRNHDFSVGRRTPSQRVGPQRQMHGRAIVQTLPTLARRSIVGLFCRKHVQRGFFDPDQGICVSPSAVHWIEGVGFPNASTVGRNTLHTGGTNNFDVTILRALSIGEGKQLEFRWEKLKMPSTILIYDQMRRSVTS